MKPSPDRTATKTAIIQAAAEVFGVTPEKMTGKSRQRDIVLARQVAMYAYKKNYPEKSFREIADLFEQNHATAMYAIKNVENLISVYKNLRVKVKQTCYMSKLLLNNYDEFFEDFYIDNNKMLIN